MSQENKYIHRTEIIMDDNTFWVLVTGIIAASIFAVAAILGNGYTSRVKAAFDAGYVESTVPGSNAIVWTKP